MLSWRTKLENCGDVSCLNSGEKETDVVVFEMRAKDAPAEFAYV